MNAASSAPYDPRIALMRTSRLFVIVGLAVVALIVAILRSKDTDMPASLRQYFEDRSNEPTTLPMANNEQATFGTGCFWCTEAIFAQLKGVQSAVSGYSGGRTKHPTYDAVCAGLTGHAEVVQVTYDPRVISYAELLEVFWITHDPTTLNRQGIDVGTQYRSAIFYHSDQQRQLAEYYKDKLDTAGAFRKPIVTEITQFQEFYPAEKYHQDYFASNPTQRYCSSVIRPKVEKFRDVFADKLRGIPAAADQ